MEEEHGVRMEENKSWTARWIWAEPSAARPAQPFELVYFRREFVVPDTGGHHKLVADVSADSRYRLYLNGKSVMAGPCRGDRFTHYYDTLDLTSLLTTGRNVLAAKVLHYGQESPAPLAVVSAPAGAFLLQGSIVGPSGSVVEELSTGISAWRCLRDRAVGFVPETVTCVGGGEQVEGGLLPHGWEGTGYDSGNWQPAVEVAWTIDRLHGLLSPWPLQVRPIPEMYERERSFKRIMRQEGLPTGSRTEDWIAGNEPLRIPPFTRLALELDAGELTTGFPVFVMKGGSRSEIGFVCAESYERAGGGKGVRDDPEGGVLRGIRESYRVSGTGEGTEKYETFLYRTFRFVRLEIETAAEPLTLEMPAYRETGYPLQVTASFACSDEKLLPLWEISLRTLQRCMYETYMDCPYYEQLQYSMDTRLQILFTYQVSADDRLARKAIYDFHSSLMPSGMLQSRYPSRQAQVIPGFALYWIMMVYDHYEYWGDLELVGRYRPTMDAVLDWFGRRVGQDGLVGPAPEGYWSFVDWVPYWETPNSRGVPVPGKRAPLTVTNLMYVDALRKAAEMNQATGRNDTAAEYRERASHVIVSIQKLCWSEERQLFQDGPGIGEYSQHAQIWSLLAGAAQGGKAAKLAESVLEDRSLHQVSYAMAFFLFRALSASRMYERAPDPWEPWKRQVNLHLTTWVEDSVSERSDCHAWGAVPLYEFTAEILGVKPGNAGYRSILIEPKTAALSWAKGHVATPHGTVYVEWRHHADIGKFELCVRGLNRIPTEIRFPDGSGTRLTDQEEAEFLVDWKVR